MPRFGRRNFLAAALAAPLAGCETPERARRFRPGAVARFASAVGSTRPDAPRPLAADPFAFDDELFARKRAPDPGDWLAHHAESFQSYQTYVAAGPVRPTSARSRIVLQPLGAFTKRGRELVRAVREHAACFFSLEVTVASDAALPVAGRRVRTSDGRSWQQHHTGTILKALAEKLPKDAVAYLGVTEADLYPEASWNFVFGEATLDEHVGTYSLARFLPPFADVRAPRDAKRAVRRGIKLLAHETGHAFSLPHCVRFECVMNGSNSLAESDRAPLELCPDCLRKLAYSIGFDPVERYRALGRFFSEWGLAAEAVWIARRLSQLAEAPGMR